MKFKYLVITFLFLGCSHLRAQDLHNSFFQFAPASINPALTGAFYGNLRANVIGRDEGRPVTNRNEWQALSLALDYNIDFGFTEGDWISLGGTFSRSASAGSGDFRRQFSGLLGAYHLAFGKKQDRVFTIGVKYGNYSQGFNQVDLNSYSDPFGVETGGSSTDLTSWYSNIFNTQDGQPNQKTKGDYMLGFMLDAPMGKTADIRIGISADHILEPRFNIVNQSMTPNPNPNPNPIPPAPGTTLGERLERRINAFVFLYTDINERLTFNPNLLVQRMGVTTNIVAQALFNYDYNKEKEIGLIFGLGARLINDLDIPLYIGVDMKDLRVGLSYDVNVGGLRASSNTFGALDIGVTKIFNWNKKAVVKPLFICPRL